MLFLTQSTLSEDKRGEGGGGEGGRWGSKDYEVHVARLCHEMTNRFCVTYAVL